MGWVEINKKLPLFANDITVYVKNLKDSTKKKKKKTTGTSK